MYILTQQRLESVAVLRAGRAFESFARKTRSIEGAARNLVKAARRGHIRAVVVAHRQSGQRIVERTAVVGDNLERARHLERRIRLELGTERVG
jgi:hypothetical protein